MLDSPHHLSAGNALDLPGFDDAFDSDEETLETEPLRPWYRQRRWIVAGSVALLLIIVGGTVAVVVANRKTPITYQTAQVQQGNIVTSVSATGPIQSAVYPASFPASGKLTEIDVTIGQQVTAGQVLAKIDPTALQDAVNQAQAQVNSAQTSLNGAFSSYNNTLNQQNATLSTAFIQEQNAINACNTESNPPANCVQLAKNQYASSVAQANAQKASANAQINSAQASLNSAKTQLQTAKDTLAGATLTAPHAGTIASINGVIGGTPGSGGSSSASGGSSASGFIVIDDLTALQVVADVNEADIAHVVTNQVVDFTVSAFGTQRFLGTVASISPQGASTSGVVTYPVTITVNMSSLRGANLLPQMTANASIITAQRTGVLLVPASAITFARSGVSNGLVTRAQTLAAVQQAQQLLTTAQNGQTSGTNTGQTQTVAFVLERSNAKWVVKPVVLGLSSSTAYEVVAGLTAGETVVTGQTGGTTTTTSSTTGAGNSLFGGGRGGFGGGAGGFGGGRGGGTGGTSTP